MSKAVPIVSKPKIRKLVLYETPMGGAPCSRRVGAIHISNGSIVHVDPELKGEFSLGPLTDGLSISIGRLVQGSGYAQFVEEPTE